MHILLVNDDGIQSAGLWALCTALLDDGHRVSVCAPDRPRSGASHALTLTAPLCAVPYPAPDGVNAWAVDGTPTDCAKLGLFMLANESVDLVVSGINEGYNLGAACVYSGTVAAALEAAMAGYPAVSVSLELSGGEYDSVASGICARFVEWMAAHPLPRGVSYNLNIPALPRDKLRGLRRARLAPQFLNKPSFEKVVSPRGAAYYWLTDKAATEFEHPDCDETLVRQGYATLSAITWDMRWAGEICDSAEQCLSPD